MHASHASASLMFQMHLQTSRMEAVLHCPSSWKRQDWTGKEKVQALRSGHSAHKISLPMLEKCFGRHQWKLPSGYQCALSLLPLCLIAFILLWRKPSYRAQLQFYPQGPAISEQPSELPQRASHPNAQPLQCPRAVLQSAPSADNRLMNILRKQGAETLPNNSLSLWPKKAAEGALMPEISTSHVTNWNQMDPHKPHSSQAVGTASAPPPFPVWVDSYCSRCCSQHVPLVTLLLFSDDPRLGCNTLKTDLK